MVKVHNFKYTKNHGTKHFIPMSFVAHSIHHISINCLKIDNEENQEELIFNFIITDNFPEVSKHPSLNAGILINLKPIARQK